MNPEEIRNMLRRRPFTPFRIHLSNQKTYDVREPEMVMVTRTTTHIGIVRQASPDSDFYDAWTWFPTSTSHSSNRWWRTLLVHPDS